MFIDLYTISDVNEAFDRKKLRNFDASNLLPCKSSSFCGKTLHIPFGTMLINKNLTTYQPENNGWAFENDKYHFKWFEGDQLPSYVSDSLKTQSESDIEDNQATDWSSTNEDENIDDNDV
ncbi:uncharacterized protein TNCV_207691 [Trichonephila clavipes]|nr:uncharacterized protein TNCV_207691 [Trichonephila clavipes]